MPETLRAVGLASRELGLPTILGVSNVSHGLPDRSVLSRSFLSMAMAQGLDAAIMNPLDEAMTGAARASSVPTMRDRGSAEYVRKHRAKAKRRGAAPGVAPGARPRTPEDRTIRARLARAVLDGNGTTWGSWRRRSRRGSTPSSVNDAVLVPALEEVGRRFERREVFLPQMMLAADAVARAFAKLKPLFPRSDASSAKGTIVLATVEGDVHDIGKNILGSMLESHGYRVVDLGTNVPAAAIVDAARRESADVVALSALMTTTAARVPAVMKAMRDAQVFC